VLDDAPVSWTAVPAGAPCIPEEPDASGPAPTELLDASGLKDEASAEAIPDVAVNVTTRAVPPSSPLMVQRSLNEPELVGAALTVSVSELPGTITVPSGSDVVARKMLATGGFDLVIVRLVPPVLLTVKLIERAVPGGTSP
jgi:hypothetical protein